MTMKYLGETYDIHTASRELVFPHHENEIAIAHALNGQPLARFWIHCDSVLADGKPVSRKGNGPTLDDLTRDGFSGTEIRYWLLATHYRKPLRFARQRLAAARRAVHRINTCLDSLNTRALENAAFAEIDQLLYDIRQGFVAAMDDDLNISAAMAALFTQVRRINRLLLDELLGTRDAARILEVFRSINQVLNLFEFQSPAISNAVKELVSRREAARRSGDWPLADALREEIRSMGVEVKDRALKAQG
jgi:cysteinyl-tRNA synthetase